MEPKKLAFNETKKIDLGSKIIYKYPVHTKTMDIARMVIKGRHPKDKNTFIIDHDCQFMVYILKGKGIIYAGNKKFEVKEGDVVFVPTENRYAAEGDMEYITIDVPAFYPEQYEEVKYESD